MNDKLTEKQRTLPVSMGDLEDVAQAVKAYIDREIEGVSKKAGNPDRVKQYIKDYVEQHVASIGALNSYAGVWKDGQHCLKGVFVTFAGSLWHANEDTSDQPGRSRAWTLAVKRGKAPKE